MKNFLYRNKSIGGIRIQVPENVETEIEHMSEEMLLEMDREERERRRRFDDEEEDAK